MTKSLRDEAYIRDIPGLVCAYGKYRSTETLFGKS